MNPRLRDRSLRKNVALAAAAVTAGMVLASPASGEDYRVIDLGQSLSVPVAVNEAGSVAGGRFRFDLAKGVQQVILPPNGGLLLGGDLYDIDNFGNVVGREDIFSHDHFCPRSQAAIGSLAPDVYSILATSDDGIQLGLCFSTCDAEVVTGLEACNVRSSGTTNLGVRVDQSSIKSNINSSGVSAFTIKKRVGDSVVSRAGIHSQSTGVVDLGTLGGPSSEAHDVNDHGVAVGAASTSGLSQLRPFFYETANPGAGLQTLPNIFFQSSAAYGINNAGAIVGYGTGLASLNDLNSYGFIYTAADGMKNLNTLLPRDSEYSVSAAYGINQRGDIVGSAYRSGDTAQHGVLLTKSQAVAGARSHFGGRQSDLTVYRPAAGLWFARSQQGTDQLVRQWGFSGDAPLAGDYDGDGKLDLMVWRPSNGTWYLCRSSTAFACENGTATQFGLFGDYPVVGDFDGDGRADLAVYRPSITQRARRNGRFVNVVVAQGLWYVLYSSTGQVLVKQWGLKDDRPVAADYDGDGKTDLGVYRPLSGQWYVLLSSTSFDETRSNVLQFGLSGDHPMPGDFDGDGRADFVVWRPINGTWYICSSLNNYDCQTGYGPRSTASQFGLSFDSPVGLDQDGDGPVDLAVWRPASGEWFSKSSVRASAVNFQWGLNGDFPVGAGINSLVKRLYNR